MMMQVERDGTNDLSNFFSVNENEKGLIEQLRMGDALFVCGDRHIPLHVLATENELKEMA